MRRHQAFTMIELLIALSLSSFIMLGMIQVYRNAVSSLSMCRQSMEVNRKVCLLLNELERDFTSMFVPYLAKEIVPDSEKDKQGEKDKKDAPDSKKDEESKEEKADQEQEDQKSEKNSPDNEKKSDKKTTQKKGEPPLKNALLAHTYEDEARRIQGRKFELFKNINFITTHPLQVYGDKRVRLVRVMYELVRDKKKSKPDKPCYHLYRKETADVHNFKMKEDEDAVSAGRSKIRTHLVADNVKEMFLELITVKPVDEDDPKNADKKGEQEEEEELRLFSWGEKDFTVGTVPKALNLHIVLWDDSLKRSQSFQFFVPVFSYPTTPPPQSAQQKATQPDSSKQQGGQQPQNAQQQAQAAGPGQPTRSPSPSPFQPARAPS